MTKRLFYSIHISYYGYNVLLKMYIKSEGQLWQHDIISKEKLFHEELFTDELIT